MPDRRFLFVLGIGFIFVLLNFLTITWNTPPWLDEVQFVDSPINFVLDGEWYTTSWQLSGNPKPVSTSVPLYQFILVPWVWLFGVSPLAIRSLNIILVLFMSLLLFKYLDNLGFFRKHWLILLFLIGFWASDSFSWTYRSGRVDILNALTVVLFVFSYIDYLNSKRKSWYLYLFAFFIPLSGIQACPYLVIFLIWIWIFSKVHSSVIKDTIKLLFLSWGLALINLLVFFYYHEGVIGFLASFIMRSSTLKSLSSFILPYIGSMLDVDVSQWTSKLLFDPKGPSFVERILELYFHNKSYFILNLFNLISIFFLLFIRKYRLNKSILLVIGFSILAPLFILLIGRFQSYYSWMAFLPALVGASLIVESYNYLFTKLIYWFSILYIIFTGLPTKLLYADPSAYFELEQYIKGHNIDVDNDVILASYRTYYSVRNITNKVYFIHTYPIEMLPSKPTIAIVSQADGPWGVEVENYLAALKRNGEPVNLIDSLANPRIYYYELY